MFEALRSPRIRAGSGEWAMGLSAPPSRHHFASTPRCWVVRLLHRPRRACPRSPRHYQCTSFQEDWVLLYVFVVVFLNITVVPCMWFLTSLSRVSVSLGEVHISSWAIFLIFRCPCFYPLQTSSAFLFSCLSRTEITRGGKDICSICFKRSVSGFPLHTKNWSLEHLLSKPGSSALHSRMSHRGCR